MSETQLATVTEALGLGMILIRADLGRAGDAIAEAAGLPIPERTRFTADGTRWLGWMSPDELLLTLPSAEAGAALADLRDALSTEHALVEDVSAMRCVFDVSGRKPVDVLAKLCPVDFETLPPDAVRRTRAAQVACALWRHDEGFRIVAFRSVRDYLGGVLIASATARAQLQPR